MPRKLLVKNEKGQTLVEFAIILPLFLLLLFGIMQFAIIFSSYLIVYDAVNDAVRMGAVGSSDANIKEYIMGKTSVMSFLVITEDNIQVSPIRELRRMDAYITVSVPVAVTIIFPFYNLILGDKFAFESSASMRYELTDQYQHDSAAEIFVDVFHLENTKNNPKTGDEIKVVFAISDNYGNPIADAGVTIQIKKDGSNLCTVAGSTGIDGTFIGGFNNTGTGSYVGEVMDIEAGSLTWSGSNLYAELYLGI